MKILLDGFPSYIRKSFGLFLAYSFGEPNRTLLEIEWIAPRKKGKICRACGQPIKVGKDDRYKPNQCYSLKFGTENGKLFNGYLHEGCFQGIVGKLADFVENIGFKCLDFSKEEGIFIDKP